MPKGTERGEEKRREMTEEIKAKYGIDTTDFDTGIKSINRSIRLIESGFQASAASMDDWSNSAEGLESRISSLTEKISLQQTKVDVLKTEYERVAAEKGKTSQAAQNLEIKLNKETETLNKMEAELGQSETALKNVGKESDETGKDMDKASSSGDRLGDVMRGLGGALKVGMAAIAGLAVAAVGAATAMAGLVFSSADMAGELVDASNKTGISVERLQELAFIGEQVGVSTETMSGSMAKLTRSMSGAREQQEAFDEQLAAGVMEDQITGPMDMAEAFNQLGVAYTNADGSLRDSEDVFTDALGALGKVSNETERDALAMEIFGKSAMELNPLIKTSAEEMDAMSQKAHDLGAVVDEDSVGALETFGDTVAGLQAGVKGTGAEIAAAFLPAFSGLAEDAEDYLGDFSDIVKGADGDLGDMADGIGGLVGRIATDLVSQAPQMLTAGLGLIQGLINAILTALPALLPAAIAMINSLVGFLVTNLPMLMTAGITLVMALVNGILPQLPMLLGAALQMIITLALGIAQALPQMIPAILAIIPQLILVLIQNLPLLIGAALQIILALATGLITAIPILIPYIPQIVTAIVTALGTALPMIWQAAVDLVNMLWQGIQDTMPVLEEAAPQVIQTIGEALQAVWDDILAIGKNIVEGVWQGILDAEAWLFEKVKGFFANLIKAAKEALDMRSPSREFAKIGELTAEGFGVGFANSFGAIRSDVQNAITGMTAAVNSNLNVGGGFAYAGAGAYGQGGIGQAGIQIIIQATVTGELDEYRMAQRVADTLMRLR